MADEDQAGDDVIDLTGIFDSGEKVHSVGLPQGVEEDRRVVGPGDRRAGPFTDRRQGQRRRLARTSTRRADHAVDPMSIYLREMGTLTLLSHEEELELARMMEEGLLQVQNAVLSTPLAIPALQQVAEELRADNMKIFQILRGIQDNQPAVVAKEKKAFLKKVDKALVLEQKDWLSKSSSLIVQKIWQK